MVGFGEVGYDHTEHESTWVDQLDRLDRQLRDLGPDHVLVLYGRGVRMANQLIRLDWRSFIFCVAGLK